jgi:hypothetical protein
MVSKDHLMNTMTSPRIVELASKTRRLDSYKYVAEICNRPAKDTDMVFPGSICFVQDKPVR